MIQIPPKSIVVNTQEILSACEIAEVMNHENHQTTTDESIPTTSQIAVRTYIPYFPL